MILESTNCPMTLNHSSRLSLLNSSKSTICRRWFVCFKTNSLVAKASRFPAVNPNQLQLFTPPEPVEPVQPDEDIAIKGHTRKKRGRKPLPEDLPRVEIVHDLPEEEKPCACGAN